MGHITRLSGPSRVEDYPVAVTVHTSRVHDIVDAADTEEDQCPGGSSTTFTSKPSSSKTPGVPSRSRRARTTENP